MIGFYLKLMFLTIFSLLVIYSYYFQYDFHQVSSSGTFSYIFTLIFFYGIYKTFNYIKGDSTLKFTPLSLFGFFMLQVLILSIMFFTLNGNDGGLGLNLFFMIVFFMILPIIITLVSISIGKFFINKIPEIENESSIFRFLSSLGLGFFIFITSLSILGFFGAYNLISVFGLLILFAGISYKELLQITKSLYTHKFEIQDHDFSSKNLLDKINPKLLSSEFFFIIITFLLAVNLINIVRPMPIGWDDMGVYMNYPQILANAGIIGNMGGSLSWSVFTGIGYMFQSATQAFFLNNVGGVLSVIVIVLATYDLVSRNLKKSLINLHLLAGAILASMPMIIFQQAKDQKQDPGLFFISAIAIYLLLYVFLKYIGYKRTYKGENIELSEDVGENGKSIDIKYSEEKKGNIFLAHFKKYTHIGKKDLFENKSYLIYVFIIGILAGFAFSIKVTSLLLISGIFGVVFYSKLGVAGLFGYFATYVGIFTYLGLWDLMNVIYPQDSNFKLNVLIYSLVTAFILFAYSVYKYSIKSLNKTIIISSVVLLGFLSAMAPWFGKNIVSLGGEVSSVSQLLNGKTDRFSIDYNLIYTDEELEEIRKQKLETGNRGITDQGITTNEDFGRYIGYEAGINNFLKLPYNLTMQVNQRGEYTDITYIYFAFLPAILLFLAYKINILNLGVFLISLFPLLFFFFAPVNLHITNILASYTLPVGYIVIALFFIIPFLYINYSLNKEKLSVLFKINLVFALFYVFLWTISAFGIVWYGIAMYFSLILAILIGISYIVNIEDSDDNYIKVLKYIGSVIVFTIVLIYFVFSSIPHGLNNVINAGYTTFKAGKVDRYTGIIGAQPHYFPILLELNVSDKETLFNDITENISIELSQVLTQNNINDLIKLESGLKELSQINLGNSALSREVENILTEIYKNTLYPQYNNSNNKAIYRVGTFLRYFVVNNRQRTHDDNLLNRFDEYIFDEDNIDKGVQRIKDLGMDYLLADLNAATIDRDSRRDLTRRYENLLKTFTSSNLELVGTDSLCLQTALESYNYGLISIEDYMLIAGVNYESYEAGELTYHRGQKQVMCYNHMLELMGEGYVNENNYTHLLPISNAIKKMGDVNEEILINFFRQNVRHGWMAVFRIK